MRTVTVKIGNHRMSFEVESFVVNTDGKTFTVEITLHKEKERLTFPIEIFEHVTSGGSDD